MTGWLVRCGCGWDAHRFFDHLWAGGFLGAAMLLLKLPADRVSCESIAGNLSLIPGVQHEIGER